MRTKTILEHPDFKYIVNQLKKGTPKNKIVEKVNKRGKGKPISRHMLLRFIKENDFETDAKIKTEKIMNEREKAEVECGLQIEAVITNTIIPTQQKIENLYDLAVDKAEIVFLEAINGARKMQDFNIYMDAVKKISDLKQEANNLLPNASNDYEQYILDTEFEEEEGAN